MNINAEENSIENWSKRAAGLAVDALVDAGLVKTEDFDKAAEIVEEEIFVRLVIGDSPIPRPVDR